MIENCRSFVGILALCVVVQGTASARPINVVTWPEIEAAALKLNPQLASAVDTRDAQDSAFKGSYNGLLPSVSLTNGWTAASGAPSGWQAQAGVSVNLFDASRIASIKSAAAALDKASAELWSVSASVRFQLRQAFLTLLYTQESRVVALTVADIRARDAEMVSLRFESGTESLGNKLRADAQDLQAREDIAQVGRSLRTTARALSAQLGEEEFAEVTATGTLDAAVVPDLPKDDGALLARRPDVSIQDATIKAAQATVSSARSSIFPSLNLAYDRTSTGASEFPSSQYAWTAGATLSLPVFGGGLMSVYHDVKAAQRNLAAAKETLRSVRAQALLDIETAWSNYAKAEAQVRVQSSLLEAARQRNDEADVRYSSGLLTYDNWEIITSDRVNQETQALQARLTAATAQAQWEQSLGVRLGESN